MDKVAAGSVKMCQQRRKFQVSRAAKVVWVQANLVFAMLSWHLKPLPNRRRGKHTKSRKHQEAEVAVQANLAENFPRLMVA